MTVIMVQGTTLASERDFKIYRKTLLQSDLSAIYRM
jgi:hypothetical protein